MIRIKKKNSFISKKEIIKLDLLSILLERRTITLDDMTNFYTISNRTAKNLLIELIEETQAIDSSLDISLNGNTIKFGNKFNYETYLIVYKTLQLNYYENSISFQLFTLLFKYKSISIYDLSEKLMVSHSYLYKLIKDLSDQLKLYNLNIHIDVQAYKVSFFGDEIEIRCLVYYTFSLIFNTLDSKFKPNVTHSSKVFNNNKYTETTNHLITMVDSIFMLRKEQLYPLPALGKEEVAFVNLIKQVCPRYSLTSLDNNESSAMLLWLTYVAPDIITNDEKKMIGKHLFESQLEIVPFFKTFLHAVKEEFNCSKEVIFLLMWEYYARFIVYRFFKCWKYKNIVEIKRNKNRYIDRIEVITKIHLKNILSPLAIQQYADELSELAYSYLDLLTPVKVHIDLFEYSSLKIFIKNILGRSYRTDILVFTANPDEADLIITNVIPIKKRNVELFYFSDISSEVNWEELGKAIQAQILKLNWAI